MGKLKQSLIIAEEEQFNANEIDYGWRGIIRNVPPTTKEELVSYGIANQQDWSEYEKEFNAWLDAYEASFGDRSDL